MINPPAAPPTKAEKVATVVKTVERKIARERDLIIAVLFLITGFVLARL